MLSLFKFSFRLCYETLMTCTCFISIISMCIFSSYNLDVIQWQLKEKDLEWNGISHAVFWKWGFSGEFSSLISWKVKVLVTQSCQALCNPMDCSPPGLSVHEIVQAIILNWVASSLLQGIFPTQGSKLGLPHCRKIPSRLSNQGSPNFLDGFK